MERGGAVGQIPPRGRICSSVCKSVIFGLSIELPYDSLQMHLEILNVVVNSFKSGERKFVMDDVRAIAPLSSPINDVAYPI